MFDALIPAIIALPLAGFLFTAVVGRRLGKRAHLVPVGAVVLAWLIGMWSSSAPCPAPSRSASTATA